MSSKLQKKVLVISHDKVGPLMAGPGIRYHEMGKFLAANHDVTLGFFSPGNVPDKKFNGPYGTRLLDANQAGFMGDFDVVVSMYFSDAMLRQSRESGAVCIVDMYAPGPIENIVLNHYSGAVSAESDSNYQREASRYRSYFLNADYFLVSNDRQRDFWVGYAIASGVTKPSAYDEGLFSRFIIAPMGMEQLESPPQKSNKLAEALGIPASAKIALWTGGIWNFFDAVAAVEAIAKTKTDTRLVFLGTKHPNPDVQEMSESDKALKAAKSLDLLDKKVYFMYGWLPYEERGSYYASGDFALYLHKSDFEARYSHRTRVLDHLLFGLPTVASAGDYLSDKLEKEGMAVTISKPTPTKIAQALDALAGSDQLLTMREAVVSGRDAFQWASSLAGLELAINSPVRLRHVYMAQAAIAVAEREDLASTLKRLMPSALKRALKKAITRV